MDKNLLHYMAVPINVVLQQDWLEKKSTLNLSKYTQVYVYSIAELEDKDFKQILELLQNNFNSRAKIWYAIKHVEYIACVYSLQDDKQPIVACALLCGGTIRSIEYVCTDSKHRGNSLATNAVKELIHFTFTYLPDTPHLTLVSKPELRSLYENCGFTCIAESD